MASTMTKIVGGTIARIAMQRLATPFGFHSTATEVAAGVDLRGKRGIVTGGAAGIGIETVRTLALAGAEITLAARRPDAARPVAEELRQATGNAALEVRPLDLSDLRSVQSFVDDWTGPLHILVNNAGIMAVPELEKTPQGFELQFGTNYLGHFALTLGLHRARRVGEFHRASLLPGDLRRSGFRLRALYALRRLWAVQVGRDAAVGRHNPEMGRGRNPVELTQPRRHRDRAAEAHGWPENACRAPQDARTGRGDQRPARRVAAARRHQRTIFRGLQRGGTAHEAAGRPDGRLCRLCP